MQISTCFKFSTNVGHVFPDSNFHSLIEFSATNVNYIYFFILSPKPHVNRLYGFALLLELLNDKTRMTVYRSLSQCIRVYLSFLIHFISKSSFRIIDTHISLLMKRRIMRMIFFAFFLNISPLPLYQLCISYTNVWFSSMINLQQLWY